MTSSLVSGDPTPDYAMHLAAVIRGRMFVMRRQQAELADLLGCSKQKISHMLVGRNGISTAELFAIAEALETTAADLLEEVGRSVVRHQGLEPRTR